MKKLSAPPRKQKKPARATWRLRAVFVAPAALMVFCVLYVNSYTQSINNGLADSLIRLHVVANSDSAEDQELKYTVRDAVLAYMREIVKESENIGRAASIITADMAGITAAAEKAVLESGRSYGIKAGFGTYIFPTKAYGDIVLPAGRYQALKIVIGKGEGSNWWCVLFPPLCFVDVTHGIVPDSVKEELKQALTEEEYGIIASSDEESDIPVKIKFKIVEIFQESKARLAGAVEKLFGPQS